MMKKYKIKIVNALLAIVMILAINVTTYAEPRQGNLGETIDGSMLTNETFSEKIMENRTRGNFLNRGVARLTNNGNGSVNSYGAVVGAVICDRLELRMTLQRLQGGTWTTVKTFSDTAYNSSLLTKSYNTSVAGGYYYRLKVACVAFEGGASESQMPVTDGIWID